MEQIYSVLKPTYKAHSTNGQSRYKIQL